MERKDDENFKRPQDRPAKGKQGAKEVASRYLQPATPKATPASSSATSGTLSRTKDARLNVKRPQVPFAFGTPTPTAGLGRSGQLTSVTPRSAATRIAGARKQDLQVATPSLSAANSLGAGRGLRRTVTTSAGSENCGRGIGHAAVEATPKHSKILDSSSHAQRGLSRYNSLTSATRGPQATRTEKAAAAAVATLASAAGQERFVGANLEDRSTTGAAGPSLRSHPPPVGSKTNEQHIFMHPSSKLKESNAEVLQGRRTPAAAVRPFRAQGSSALKQQVAGTGLKADASVKASSRASEEDHSAKLQELFANPPPRHTEADLGLLPDEERQKIVRVQDLVWKLYLLKVQEEYNKSIAQQEAEFQEQLQLHSALQREVQALRGQAEAQRHEDALNAYAPRTAPEVLSEESTQCGMERVDACTKEIHTLVETALTAKEEALFLEEVLGHLE